MNKLVIGAAQIAPELQNLKHNTEKHLEYIARAHEQKVDVLVFPELSLTGYDFQEAAPELAITPDDPHILKLAEAAGSMPVIVGFVELGYAAQIYNSAVVLLNGQPLFIHRKLNLPNYGALEEGKHFGSGRFIDNLEIRNPWWASVLLCADAWNPALVHLCAMKGSTLLCIPANSARGTVGEGEFSNPENWALCMKFYSRIYGLPVVMVNRTGVERAYEFWGNSAILNSRGEIIAQAGSDEELVVAPLHYQDIVRSRAILPTVRDSNMDLIHREISRMRDSIGSPSFWIAETIEHSRDREVD